MGSCSSSAVRAASEPSSLFCTLFEALVRRKRRRRAAGNDESESVLGAPALLASGVGAGAVIEVVDT